MNLPLESSTSEQMVAPRRALFAALPILFVLTLVLVLFVGVRLSQRGHWLPKPPGDFKQWVAAEESLNRLEMEPLGFPPGIGFTYSNLFLEEVKVRVIGTNSFESYLDPRTFLAPFGYGITAQKGVRIFGQDGLVRAMVLRNPRSEKMVLMYYWIQSRNGRTSAVGTIQRANDIFSRLRLGGASVLDGDPNCVVQVFTNILPSDRNGVQARQNVEEICRQVHSVIKQQQSIGGGG